MEPFMNEEEKRLLGSLIREDDALYPYQQEALNQLKGAMAYMRAKYPSCELEFRYFDPDVKTTERGVLIVNRKGSPILHKTIIRKEADGYAYTDDLYGELIREKYDDALTEEITAFTGPVRAYTMFYSFVSKEIDETVSVDAVLKDHTGIRRHTDLFSDKELNITESLKKHLLSLGFCASYTVFLAPKDHCVNVPAKERYEGCRQTASFVIRAEGDRQ